MKVYYTEIMDWSIDGQTPEFLAATRMASLSGSVIASILPHLNLKPHMKVLDVGCGSGEYCFRLGSAVSDVDFTGLEYDPGFVEFANRRVAGEAGYPFEAPNPDNTYRFICGNGLDLPFDDGAFDAVVSHTYLTAVPDWACALAEMCRVCKPGGTVSSVTSMTDDFYGTGTIGLFSGLFVPESAELLQLVDSAKAAVFTPMNLCSGIAPRKAPVAFDWIGLEDVRCAPLAHYFCLSDAGITKLEKERYVDLLHAMERTSLARLKEHPQARSILSDEQWDAYGRLLDERRSSLKSQVANREWDWYGNSSLLVCGTVPDKAPRERWTAFREEHRKAQAILRACEEAGIELCPELEQLGPGRCVRSTASTGSGEICVFGFDPPRALVETCGIARGSEARYSQIEEQVSTEISEFDSLPCLPNDLVFGIPEMWETVSEASLCGISVQFKDAGSFEGCVSVACVAARADDVTCALAVNSDVREAAMRAFARAIGSLQAQDLLC